MDNIFDIKNENRDAIGIYVHIPFCVQKCLYCDFNSYAGAEERRDEYIRALLGEIRATANRPGVGGAKADSVYIGGGTPTTLKPQYINTILRELKDRFDIADNAEITVECNPKTAEKADFEKLLRAGANRLSIGLQSDDDVLLKKLGRIHLYEDFLKCLSDAKEAGFENISADLMFGIPGQTLGIWEKTLRNVSGLGLKHLSCYSLKIEEGTPFYERYGEGDSKDLPDDDENRDMYDACVNILRENGYNRYEISNFALPGYESRHNLKYWDMSEFLGFGAGAYSYFDHYRYNNISGLSEYIAASDKVEDSVKLSAADEMSEFVFLGLRRDAGISVGAFLRRFGTNIFDVYAKPLEKYIKNGILLFDGDNIKIREDMVFVSNYILSDFV